MPPPIGTRLRPTLSARSVTGPLHWLGLVDTAALPGALGRPSAFRLTDMGRWVLDLGPPPAIQAEGGRVIVQPNLHIVALDPVADATLVELDQFAERLSAERAVEYRLTRASVYAGQQAGWDVPRIKTYLRGHTRAELPGNVERTLDEWQAQHERIILRTGVSLAHGPAGLFDALLADPSSQPLVAGRPAPEVVTLAAPVAGFIDAVSRLGVLPLLNQPAAPAKEFRRSRRRRPRAPAGRAAPASTCTATWPPLPTRPAMALTKFLPRASPGPCAPA